MIIDVNYIRKFRPIANNIDDNKVEIYIAEAEKMDIIPAIGAALYQRLTNIGIITTDHPDEDIQTEEGDTISVQSEYDLPIEEFKLLNGGYYTDKGGCKQHFEGIKAALAYLAYSRFIRNHSTNVTAYGVVAKMGEDSSPVDARTISAVAMEAARVGQEYLSGSLRFWSDTKANEDLNKQSKVSRRRFIPIGD